MTTKPKILFMCVANSCRSQMAEVLGHHYLGHKFDVYSAGSKPTQPNARALKALKSCGYDTTALFSKSFDQVPDDMDYVISLCQEQELTCPTFPATVKVLAWPTPDPVSASGQKNEIREFFTETLRSIEQKIIQFQQELSDN
ncbi:TPA: arsenate reductase ArsC [Candidatus Poribacteria bacterium]|nr:arsenate reductase ArsC [Candidatus Poribacteria bacterium]HIB87330.1 arsenate reductase ArsC [Candidatus Poribacteria bacterium]HIC01270.1 arsenate reductase ArsC [Candidatus Poribacteria bacterium]HIO05485.1 arsenate reductase ArsC [Candidatus Poribacteria bacterium]HIO50274.1 arsenate reductase ArsC [Candidatus Poribacteria bacterium]